MSDRLFIVGGLVLRPRSSAQGTPEWGAIFVDLVIEDGLVHELSGARPGTEPRERIIDARGMIVLPAFTNAHTHSFERAFRGWKSFRSIDDPHPDWFWDLYRSLPRDLALLGSRMHYAENLAAGVTCVLDVLRPDLEPSAFDEQRLALGLNGLVFSERLDYGAYDIGHESHKAFVERLATAERLAPDTVLHMHYQETWARKASALDQFGVPMSDLLRERGLLGRRFVLSHCGASKREDLVGFDRERTVVVATPIAEARLGEPTVDPTLLRELGLPLAIGTDGPCYDPRIDPFALMRWLLARWDRVQCLEAHGEVLTAATRVPRAACEGRPADLVLIETRDSAIGPLVQKPYDNLIEMLIWGGAPSDVVGTIAGGDLAYWRGCWPNHDLAVTRRELESRFIEFLHDTVGGEVYARSV